MRKRFYSTYISRIVFFALVCSNLKGFTQSDTSKSGLRFPIQDRNTDFFSTKPSTTLDLKDPKIITQKVEYDPKTNKFIVYEKIGDTYYKAPTYMTYDEYLQYSSQQSEQTYFQQRSRAIDLAERKSKQPFLYQGPELFNRFLGGTKIEIKPQGNVDVTVGVNSQRTDNPVLLQNQRRTVNFDFDMNIQLGLQASVGDKIKLGINYNTKSGFSFENQLKLAYKGKEDDIIQALEFGNVSLPLRSALIKGPQNLFGMKSQLKFGRLTITNILSQQKSKTESVRIENGAQTKKFSIKADEYEDNRHFFIAQYFRDTYEQSLSRLPFVGAQVVINRIEVWVTNKTRQTENVREIVAFQDLGEISKVYNPSLLNGNTNAYPESNSNNLYNIVTNGANAIDFRDPSRCISFLESNGLRSVDDFEKTSARKLATTEYYFNPQLGYISLNQQLRPDEVLGVAIQYTVNGKVYQLGEFATDLPPLADTTKTKDQILVLKLLKASSVRTTEPVWDLMMKNVYSLNAYNISDEQFFFDIYYIDPGGGQKRYLPDGGNISGVQLIKALNLDNVNNQLDPQPDGRFDFIPNVTISPRNGKIYFPVLEPFGSSLGNAIGDPAIASKYVYRYLYDTTKTAATQFPEFNRFVMKGSYRGTDNSTFRLPGAFNLPQGSVSVSAGGNLLTENVDYTVNYGIGEVVIVNQGVLNAGVPIDIKFENNVLFGVVNKTLMGTRLDYSVNKNFTIGFTHLHLSERPFTQKVNFNDDPIKNNVIGLDINYSTESKGLSRAFNKITAQDLTGASKISFAAEAAHFMPGHSKAINIDNAGTVYVDDFEGASTNFDLRGSFLTWSLASAPKGMPDRFGAEKFPEARLSDSLAYGFNRAKLSWYSIDPVFQGALGTNPLDDATAQATRDNIYTRQYFERDVFRNRENATINNPPLFTLDLSYFPDERGPYNFETTPSAYSRGVAANGKLNNPETRWGGIMRTIETTSDFEAANIEFIQFWVLDPFKFPGGNRKGNLYLQLGNLSEDILKDSRKQYENGLPRPNAATTVDTSSWGVTPTIQNALTNQFDADPDVIRKQDVGLDGLDDDAEKNFYAGYISKLATVVTNPDVLTKANDDPSNDDYIFHRDARFLASDNVITRYKDFSNTQGNSSNNLVGGNVNGNSKTQPDNEDLNNDNTLNETEEYFQYRVAFDESSLANSPFIADKVAVPLNGNDSAYWYQVKIPIKEYEQRVGNISDFRSIRFVRLLLADFDQAVTLRFAQFSLVRNQWRRYDLSLANPGEELPGDDISNTDFNISSVSVEENSSRSPIPYAIPPGINREQNISGYNNALQNEQAMSLQVCELKDGDARAVYRVTNLDLRNYKRIKLFTHAENFPGDRGSSFPIKDNDISAFIRIGSDFTENYYEYELPLKVTLPGNYNTESDADKRLIWPDSNQMNILLDSLTKVKQIRNQSNASLILPFDVTLGNGSKISIKGNPDLGVASVFMIGIKNPKRIIGENDATDDGLSKCAEIWVNELRMSGFDEQSGWAAMGRVDMQLGNLGNLVLAGNMHTIGYGDLEQRLNQRYRDNYYQYDIAANLQLGNLLEGLAGPHRVVVAGGHHHQPERRRLAQQGVEELQAGLVGGVEVVEEEVERAAVGQRREGLAHAVEEGAANLGRIAARRRHRPAEGVVGGGGVGQARRRQDVGEEGPGRRDRPRRRAPQHREAARLGQPGPLQRRPGGAGAGLAEEHHRPVAPRQQRLQPGHHALPAAQRGEPLPPEEAAGQAAGGVAGGVRPRPHLAAGDGVAQRLGVHRGGAQAGGPLGRGAGVVLVERLGAVAVLGEEPHQEGVSLLAGGVGGEEAAQQRDGRRGVTPQGLLAGQRVGRLGEEGAEAAAVIVEPGAGLVVRRQVPAVEVHRGPVPLHAAGAHRALQQVRVHPGLGGEGDRAVVHVHVPAAQHLAQVVEGAVEVVGAGGGILAGPERVVDHLARHGAAWREHQEGEQVGRPAAAPGGGRDGHPAPGHLEPPQQVDLEPRPHAGGR